MKFLCICWAGHCRSVTLARAFHLWGHQAVAIGLCTSGKDLMETLCEWADVICPLQKKFIDGIPTTYHYKTTDHFDIGEDVWHAPYNKDMQKKLDEKIRSYLITNKIPHLTTTLRPQDSVIIRDSLYPKQELVYKKE